MFIFLWSGVTKYFETAAELKITRNKRQLSVDSQCFSSSKVCCTPGHFYFRSKARTGIKARTGSQNSTFLRSSIVANPLFPIRFLNGRFSVRVWTLLLSFCSHFLPFPWLTNSGRIMKPVLCQYLRSVLHCIWERKRENAENVIAQFQPFLPGRLTLEILKVINSATTLTVTP